MSKSGTISFIAVLVLVVLIGIAAWYFAPTWTAWRWDADAMAIYLTGTGAVGAAIWALFSQRIIARRQCTFEHIAASESDHDQIAGRLNFRKLTQTAGALTELALPDKEHTPEFQMLV